MLHLRESCTRAHNNSARIITQTCNDVWRPWGQIGIHDVSRCVSTISVIYYYMHENVKHTQKHVETTATPRSVCILSVQCLDRHTQFCAWPRNIRSWDTLLQHVFLSVAVYRRFILVEHITATALTRNRVRILRLSYVLARTCVSIFRTRSVQRSVNANGNPLAAQFSTATLRCDRPSVQLSSGSVYVCLFAWSFALSGRNSEWLSLPLWPPTASFDWHIWTYTLEHMSCQSLCRVVVCHMCMHMRHMSVIVCVSSLCKRVCVVGSMQ